MKEELAKSFVDWLLIQAPVIVILVPLVVYLLWRNHKLSKSLVDVLKESSENRLSDARSHAEEKSAMAEMHWKERDRLRTDAMLQHDATSKNMLSSLEAALVRKLSESDY